MKKGIATVSRAKICSPVENGGLKINNLQHENNAYLFKLTWNFSYSNKPWSLLLKARVLKSKYRLKLAYRSSFIWPGLNNFMTLFLNIPLGKLVHVLLLIYRMINGVFLLVYQTYRGT